MTGSALTPADETVLAYLRERGPGDITVAAIAQATGLSRLTVQVSLYTLNAAHLICITQWIADWGTTRYRLRHTHPPD